MKFAQFLINELFRKSEEYSKTLLVESANYGMKKILSKKDYGSYYVVDGIHSGKEWKCEDFPMSSAYDKNDQYLGDPKFVKHIVEKYKIEIFEKTKPDNTICTIGYSPKTNSWSGWSHRGICDFYVGSEVKPGDCAFEPSNKKEFIDEMKRWYGDLGYKIEKTKDGVIATKDDSELTMDLKYPEKWGKGKWKAKTLKDAKQMAIAYAKGVS